MFPPQFNRGGNMIAIVRQLNCRAFVSNQTQFHPQMRSLEPQPLIKAVRLHP
jgi:hypothetical protein